MKNPIRNIVFSLVPVAVLLFAGELFCRAAYYQNKGTRPLALHAAVESLTQSLARKRAESAVKQRGMKPEDFPLLYSDVGAPLLDEFKRRYEEEFSRLVREVASVKAKLVVVYMPSSDYTQTNIREISRRFYQELTAQYGVDYLDLTPEFLKYPVDTVTLLPENGHLSRFGNKIVARELAKHLQKYRGYTSDFSCNRRPRLFGDLPPKQRRVWELIPEIPFLVVTNKQGLRCNHDVVFPKPRQRILALGDSYTYGPYLPYCHTYPHFLEQELPGTEVLNAGVTGYTITDEAGLFSERAKYAEPDIVVLEVLDNDLYGLFFFKQNEFDRKKRVRRPSAAEEEFISRVLKSKSSVN